MMYNSHNYSNVFLVSILVFLAPDPLPNHSRACERVCQKVVSEYILGVYMAQGCHAVAKCLGCSRGVRYCYDFGQKCTRGVRYCYVSLSKIAKSVLGGYGIVMFQSDRTVGTVLLCFSQIGRYGIVMFMILIKMGYGYGYFSREARENFGGIVMVMVMILTKMRYGYGYFSREARENFGVLLWLWL